MASYTLVIQTLYSPSTILPGFWYCYIAANPPPLLIPHSNVIHFLVHSPSSKTIEFQQNKITCSAVNDDRTTTAAIAAVVHCMHETRFARVRGARSAEGYRTTCVTKLTVGRVAAAGGGTARVIVLMESCCYFSFVLNKVSWYERSLRGA